MFLYYNIYVSNYKSKNRHKYLLQYHLILVCKYRKSLFTNYILSKDIKDLSVKICSKYNIIIKYMETDKDHIHYMLEIPPVISISKVVRLIKSYTTYHIWKLHHNYLKKNFWKEKTFWTDGYFVLSIGNVSENVLKEYIENQG